MPDRAGVAPRPGLRLCLSGTELAAGEDVGVLTAAALDTGAAGVELWFPANTGADLAGAVERVRAAGVAVASIGTPTQLSTEGRWEADREVLTEAVRQAGRAGVPLVNTYFGYWPDADDAAHTDTYARRIAPVLEVAESAGVTVTLENEFDCFGADAVHSDLTRRPAALRKLVSVIGSDRFALTFDACNAWFTGLDPAVFFAEVGEHVAQVHVKDGREVDGPIGPWRRFADRGVAYATCPLGAGGLDWPRLLDLVWDTGYRGWLNIEPHSAPEHRAQAWTQAVGHLRALLGARHDENGHGTW